MASVVQWIVANWATLVGILTGLLSLASLVTALTPTPKDDEVVRKVMAFLSFLQPRTSPGVLKPPMTQPAPEPDPESGNPSFGRLDNRH